MLSTKTKKENNNAIGVYTYAEAFANCLLYFKGDELAANTWLSKYAMRNKKGEFIECSPDDMHLRMAKEFGRVEAKYTSKALKPSAQKSLSGYGKQRKKLDTNTIYELFKNFKYVIPQGSVMSSLGNPNVIASLSNCIVLPEIYDSYGGVFYTDQQMAQLFKRRCGVGVDISTLRPSGQHVSNSAGTTSGAVSFMDRFSNTTREVAQNGRRGALMITMDIAHPDIEQFITIKQDLKKITGANISIKVSDAFMKAVKNKTKFTLKFPIDSDKPTFTKEIDALDLWEKITTCAHNTAEPGIIYWDRQHLYSTSSIYPGFKNVSTNPCSEIAMQGGDSCRLMALNLYNFVEKPFTADAQFNYSKFYEYTYEAQRLMDDLVDLELEAIERILAKVKADPEPDQIKDVEIKTWELLYNAGKRGRRTGLGFTALADSLAALNIKFDSEDGISATDLIMKTKCAAEFDSSIDMAIERGKFNDFDAAVENTSEFIDMMKEEFPALTQRMMKHGRRNISISTVAPTGSISILAQSSSGIEPVFLLSYKRRKKVNPGDQNSKVDFVDNLGDCWQEFTIYHHCLKEWMKITGQTDPEKSPYYKATASEINWENRIKLQSVVQKYTTHSISSTINLANNASVELVGDIYLRSWEAGLKGITVYRDGSRAGVLVSDKEKSNTDSVKDSVPPKRPQKINASIMRFMNHNEKWIAFVGIIDNRPYEIFTGKEEDAFVLPEWISKGWIIKSKTDGGKSRYDFQYLDKDGYKITIEGLSRSFEKEFWNYAKLISGVLRHGMPMVHVIDLIENLNFSNGTITTWKAGLERALKQFIPNGSQAKDKSCPSCGDPTGLIYEEGCLKCKSCGHSKCG
ncbi:MAG: adenosylcobalamin-dependent ribonucleoside-diphosphate reductase [Sphingobacteriaceae bacterium]|nr:adenosylcobalamin-dependent ribonucleoside-diphosphate reductase [Sphingobacteriaceae bacterium]